LELSQSQPLAHETLHNRREGVCLEQAVAVEREARDDDGRALRLSRLDDGNFWAHLYGLLGDRLRLCLSQY
jgi:hypothetical protein